MIDVTRLEKIRHRYELSYHEAEKAIKIADQRFEGDDLLGVLYVHASQFAINVRNNQRDQWNENYARRHADDWRERFPPK